MKASDSEIKLKDDIKESEKPSRYSETKFDFPVTTSATSENSSAAFGDWNDESKIGGATIEEESNGILLPGRDGGGLMTSSMLSDDIMFSSDMSTSGDGR